MNSNRTLTCSSQTGRMQQFAILNGQIDVRLGLYPAAILHPSLGCPLIVEDPQRVSLFIVADKNFRQAFLRGNGADRQFAAAGDNIRLIISQHLKIHLWEKASEAQKDLSKMDQTLFGEEYSGNLDCFYLGPLGDELRNRDGRHFANLRPSTKNQFAAAHLDEVFQIELRNWPFRPETLYDAFWAVRNEAPETLDPNERFLDVRDRMVRQFVGKTWQHGRGAQNNPGASAAGPLCAFTVDAQQGVTYKPDANVPLQSRHPIYVPPPGKPQLNIGHLSDVHLSSRQHAYKGKRAAVIPGDNNPMSPPIGDLANNNADNLFDLLEQFADDPQVDVLVITGDLYDHIHNFDPASCETPTTGKLWEAMYLDSDKAVKERATEYPYGIDALAVYSLLMHYYLHSKKKKPVLLISGNHEAYEYPYGISPRVKAIGKVNEGIPLDHNLTFYEAILLYGPGYDKVLKLFNFAKDNFDWFSTIFSPLADFALNYKNQCLLGVEWGDDESFVRSKARGGGTLPRATESLKNSQRALIDAALTQGKDTVLCSHFTVVNYSLDKSLVQKGVIDVSSAMLSDYDHGSSQGDRTALYERFINHPKLKLSLAGHSHRVGLYACDQLRTTVYPASSGGMGFSGYPAQSVEYVPQVQTNGYHPEDPATKNVAWDNRTRVFVTASAGPIPKQNLHGEMCGQGMEYPSAGKIVFNGGDAEITLVKSRRPTARPRFAVACDYIDIMKGGFWEYFKAVGSNGEFELKICWEKIHPGFAKGGKDPRFTEAMKAEFVESVTLWLVGSGSESYQGNIDRDKVVGGALRVKFPRGLQRKLRPNNIEETGAFFLSFKFKAEVVKHLPGFKDYDYESPWNIQVGIYDNWGRDVVPAKQEKDIFSRWIEKVPLTKASTDPSTWQIMRHKKFGEVPSFLWRYRKYRSEFNNNLDDLPQ